jgi:hypothetical protein
MSRFAIPSWPIRVGPGDRRRDRRPGKEREHGMNRADETNLAWTLNDAASAFLSRDARLWLCVKIGAGELESAIIELLDGYVRHNAELPSELAAPVRAWIRGYLGSDSEPILRHLLSRLRVSARPQPGTPSREPQRRPLRLVARRSARIAHNKSPSH